MSDEARKISQDRYSRSPKGRAVRRAASSRYAATEHGKAARQAYVLANRDKINARKRKWWAETQAGKEPTEAQRERSNARSRRYNERHKEAVGQRQKTYRASEHGRAAIDAHRAVNESVRYGWIKRPEACARCSAPSVPDKRGRSGTQFHHTHGYDKPHWFVGEWLCRRCHAKVD